MPEEGPLTVDDFGEARGGRLAQLDGYEGAMPDEAGPLLESVWQETSPELRRLVAALGVEAGRADDVLQDVYLAAWQKQPAGVSAAELRRWLLRVTVNRANLEHRRRARWRRVLERLWQSASRAGEPADVAAGRREERAAIRRRWPAWSRGCGRCWCCGTSPSLTRKKSARFWTCPTRPSAATSAPARKRLAAALGRAGFSNENT